MVSREIGLALNWTDRIGFFKTTNHSKCKAKFYSKFTMFSPVLVRQIPGFFFFCYNHTHISPHSNYRLFYSL